jgi:hypothetical protein
MILITKNRSNLIFKIQKVHTLYIKKKITIKRDQLIKTKKLISKQRQICFTQRQAKVKMEKMEIKY